MCDPLLVMQGAGAASSAAGSFFQASAQKTAAQSQAAIAEINAGQSYQSARDAIARGNFQQTAARLRTAQIKSDQRVGLAAGGVALDEGNALAIQATTDYMGAVDALTISENATREAAMRRMEGANFRAEGINARAAARGISPVMAGFTSLLGGATEVAGSWYKLKKTGAR